MPSIFHFWKRGGFNDTRGTLFFEVARILRDKQPRYFLLENVQGLLSHDSGATFKVIIATLAELGYCVEWQVLNTKNFGVPQSRSRVYIIGHFGEFPRRQVFPFGKDDHTYIASNKYKSSIQAQVVTGLTTEATRSDSTYIIDPQGRKNKKCVPSQISPTLKATSHKPIFVENNVLRSLTPIEFERLQTYPDNWTKDLSNTQRYKTLGNSITVYVVQQIIQRLWNIAK